MCQVVIPVPGTWDEVDVQCSRAQASDICEGLGMAWLEGNEPMGSLLVSTDSCDSSHDDDFAPHRKDICLCALPRSITCARETSAVSIVTMVMSIVCAVAVCKIACGVGRSGNTGSSHAWSDWDPNVPRVRKQPKKTLGTYAFPETSMPSDVPDLSPADAREYVRGFYATHNPGKLSELDHIMELYEGREGVLVEQLHAKYNDPEVPHMPPLPRQAAGSSAGSGHALEHAFCEYCGAALREGGCQACSGESGGTVQPLLPCMPVCDRGCGFRGSWEVVAAHESSCAFQED
jgi:hypothetical protein